ncbi:hypothetical protein CBR_g40644 [Chara braunii]|uniref:DDE Tnp4 domain-containing protein n=1 Tax=Chara braunii TaxID=69332 RepID=A0A388LU30_CHABU|nr:hypothetical protein CBR_g40644 [Chara braunii]|eukprot:GBG85834.1 hypothetical protein CBR_g40644 [Chara braunii]
MMLQTSISRRSFTCHADFSWRSRKSVHLICNDGRRSTGSHFSPSKSSPSEIYDNNTSSFGIGRASGLVAVRDITATLLRVYADKILWSARVRKHIVLQAFADKGFPNCHGAVDCTHIYVDKPANAPELQFASIGSPSLGRWWSTSFACARCVRQIFRELPQHQGHPTVKFVEAHTRGVVVFRGPPVTLSGGVKMNGCILGDNVYPQWAWVVVSYGGINQHPDEELFDTKQKVARGAVERAFGRLKGMWRLYLRTHKTNLDTLPQKLTAVCILHNILLNARIDFEENLMWEINENGVRRRVDLDIRRPPQPVAMRTSTDRAYELRNALASLVERMKHM